MASRTPSPAPSPAPFPPRAPPAARISRPAWTRSAVTAPAVAASPAGTAPPGPGSSEGGGARGSPAPPPAARGIGVPGEAGRAREGTAGGWASNRTACPCRSTVSVSVVPGGRGTGVSTSICPWPMSRRAVPGEGMAITRASNVIPLRMPSASSSTRRFAASAPTVRDSEMPSIAMSSTVHRSLSSPGFRYATRERREKAHKSEVLRYL